MDFDATIVIAHSEKQNAAATWNRTFGFHPLLCFLDRPDIAAGEAVAGLLRRGNAGSNTTADHITVLDMALASLPEYARPVKVETLDPDSGATVVTWTGPRLLACSDSGGAAHGFAQACVERGVEFSFGFPVDHRIQRIVDAIPDSCWHPALQTDRGNGQEFRDGAWVGTPSTCLAGRLVHGWSCARNGATQALNCPSPTSTARGSPPCAVRQIGG